MDEWSKRPKGEGCDSLYSFQGFWLFAQIRHLFYNLVKSLGVEEGLDDGILNSIESFSIFQNSYKNKIITSIKEVEHCEKYLQYILFENIYLYNNKNTIQNRQYMYRYINYSLFLSHEVFVQNQSEYASFKISTYIEMCEFSIRQKKFTQCFVMYKWQSFLFSSALIIYLCST